MEGFRTTGPAFRSTDDAVPVPLFKILPPHRAPTCSKDWHGFDRARLVSVLKGIVSQTEIKPVPLREVLRDEFPPSPPYAYRVLNGYHRFYASIIAGFDCLSASIKPPDEAVLEE